MDSPASRLAETMNILAHKVEITAISSIYRSEPVGYRGQPDYFNVICKAQTAFNPFRLLSVAHLIERALGRTRTFPNAPRTIDIDILDYGGLMLDTPELILPHPRLHQRAFVLVPLAEIAPEWRHPVFGKTAAELLAEAGPLERIERVGSLPGW